AGKLTADKNIVIIPTRSVPQGISALIGFNPEGEVDENKESMAEAIANVKTGQLTYAVRNTSIDGKVIHEGDFMGIDDNGIAAVGTDLNQTALELLGNMVDDDTEIISIYYGDQVKAEDAEVFKAQVAERFPDVDMEMYEGGQPVYYYLLSAE
ncbi:MAG: DAK2 domain-containing protein, partial [Lachnospiraceae bacterium]